MDLNIADSFIDNAVGHFLANEMHVPECSCPFRCMHLNAISFGAKGSLYLNGISFGAKGSMNLNAISFGTKGSMNLNAISFGAKGSVYLNAISFDAKEIGAESRNYLLDTEKNRPLHSCQSKQTHP